jgi:hypothetical protein
MNRRSGLFLVALTAMAGLAALGSSRKPGPLLLDWVAKAPKESPPLAILIEMGKRDTKPISWSGRATVSGARVVHREGYRFQKADKLIEPNAWEASSHRPVALAKGAPGTGPGQVSPALLLTEGVGTVGVVLHLSDVQEDAALTLHVQPSAGPAGVSLRDVLAGKPQALFQGAVVVRRISTVTPVVTARTEDDFPAAAYGPDGTLWLAYISYTVKDESRRIEPPYLKEQPADFKAYSTPEFGDQLFVRSYRDAQWSEPIAVTGPKEDLVRCAIAVEGNGDAWVAYSAQRQGQFGIYVRPVSKKYSPEAVANPAPRPGPEQKLTQSPGPHVNPVLCTTQTGGLLLACQSWNTAGNSGIVAFYRRGGTWECWDIVSGKITADNYCWSPAVAASPSGKGTVAFDVCKAGDYDVLIRGMELEKDDYGGLDLVPAAATARFEARPSLAYDAKGRLWIAYEEGPEKWGKDFGALDDQNGNPLYFARTIRVVCLENGRLLKPAAELPPLAGPTRSPDTGVKVEAMPRYAYPKLGLDGKGRVWLTYRQKFGTRYSTHPGSYWLTFARRLDGDHWTEPIELHHSDGLLDHRPVLLPHPDGGLRVLHNTDGRYTTPDTIDNQIYMSYIDLPGEPVEPKLVPHEPGQKDLKAADEEQAAVRRIRTYRVEAAGKQYRLLRGEFHRHTEISWDGGPDGSLEDMFRYAIDVASMDWIGNGDHDNGAGREYPWWLTQKLTDAYHVKDKFTPMFSYERSVPYPHGHRNCVFARRGIRTLPRLAEADREKRVAGVHADDTKMLYRYLKELDGVCASHTSATSMGTDWRDHDPAVEPFVEIYQGDRMSYEIEGAPRAGYDPKSGKQPVNIAGWYPKGFINHALEKGYRLGFQSSSDHFSTHLSYCIVLAERPDRETILDAMKRRHCYGATDDIIVDVKSGAHLMGDEFRTREAPTLQMAVIGTKPLAQIDVLKDSAVVETIRPGKREYRGTWTDPKPVVGVHYYYVRVLQADEELAWASPLWIDYAP